MRFICACPGARRSARVRVGVAGSLDFLRGLPEEQVGADGGAEHGDDQGHRTPWCHGSAASTRAQHLGPGHVHGEGGGDIGQQASVSHFSSARSAVGHEHLQQHRQHAEADREYRCLRTAPTSTIASPMAAMSAAMLITFATSSRPTMSVQQPGRISAADIGRQAAPGDAADARADDWMPTISG
jgi:hypothetical protein